MGGGGAANLQFATGAIAAGIGPANPGVRAGPSQIGLAPGAVPTRAGIGAGPPHIGVPAIGVAGQGACGDHMWEQERHQACPKWRHQDSEALASDTVALP